AGSDRDDQGPLHAREHQARDLRRARRRPGIHPILREGRARLCQLLALPRAGRAPGGRPGGAPGEGRSLIGSGVVTIYKYENGETTLVDVVDPAWLKPDSKVSVWVDLNHPDSEESKILRDVFHFHELAVEDALAALHHPKIESYGDYLYLILHGIDFSAREHEFKTQDVDFFVGERYLVT